MATTTQPFDEPVATPSGPLHCERCGATLDRDKAVWLELSQFTNRYHDPDTDPVPAKRSQGAFAFGKACAKHELAS